MNLLPFIATVLILFVFVLLVADRILKTSNKIIDKYAEKETSVPKPTHYSGEFLVYAMAQLLLNKEKKTVSLVHSSFACPEDIPVLRSAPKGRGLLEYYSLPEDNDHASRITLGCSPTLRADGKVRPPFQGTFDGSEDEDFGYLFKTLYAELFDLDHDDPEWENWLDALKKDCETIPFPAIALRERLRRRGYSKEHPLSCEPVILELVMNKHKFTDHCSWVVRSVWPEENTVGIRQGKHTTLVKDFQIHDNINYWNCESLLDIELPRIF